MQNHIKKFEQIHQSKLDYLTVAEQIHGPPTKLPMQLSRQSRTMSQWTTQPFLFWVFAIIIDVENEKNIMGKD